jgi:ribosomal protein L20A (L18A)
MAKALANLVDEIRQAKKEEAVNKVISELMAKDLEWNAITIKKIAKWFEEKASQSDNDVCRQSALEIIEDRFSKL